MSNQQLTSDQIDALYTHKLLTDDGKTPVVVAKEDVDALRETVAPALRQRGVSDPESLSITALAAQFRSSEEKEDAAESLSRQMPQTGGVDSADLAAGPRTGSIEAAARKLSPKEAESVDADLRKIEALESRGIDKRAGEIRGEIAESVGVDPEKVESLGRREWSNLTER